MSDVKRYTPVVNGASFIGMAEIGRDGYWAGPDVGPFVPSSDYDAIAAELEKSVNNARANWIDAEQQAARVRELEADLLLARQENAWLRAALRTRAAAAEEAERDLRLCKGHDIVAKFRMLSAERDDMLDKLIAAKARIAELEEGAPLLAEHLDRIAALERDLAACKTARDGWMKASDEAHAEIERLRAAIKRIWRAPRLSDVQVILLELRGELTTAETGVKP